MLAKHCRASIMRHIKPETKACWQCVRTASSVLAFLHLERLLATTERKLELCGFFGAMHIERMQVSMYSDGDARLAPLHSCTNSSPQFYNCLVRADVSVSIGVKHGDQALYFFQGCFFHRNLLLQITLPSQHHQEIDWQSSSRSTT